MVRGKKQFKFFKNSFKVYKILFFLSKNSEDYKSQEEKRAKGQ